MSSMLVVYYSATGNTKLIAETLAARLDCDIEAIREPKPRDVGVQKDGTPTGKDMMRSAWQGMLSLGAKVEPPTHDLSQYDLIIIAAPTWVGSLAAPARTFIRQNRKQMKKVAFIKSCGDLKESRMLGQMARLARQEPVAMQAISAKECEGGDYAAKVEEFAATLQKLA